MSKLQETVEDKRPWHVSTTGSQELDTTEQLNTAAAQQTPPRYFCPLTELTGSGNSWSNNL